MEDTFYSFIADVNETDDKWSAFLMYIYNVEYAHTSFHLFFFVNLRQAWNDWSIIYAFKADKFCNFIKTEIIQSYIDRVNSFKEYFRF